MLSNLSWLIATGIIWAMTPLIIVAATDSAVKDLNAVILVAIVMIAAALSTRSVWNAGYESAPDVAEKSKRTGSRRVRRLMDSLSDDELEELRARLSSDGEVVPLQTLLARQERRSRTENGGACFARHRFHCDPGRAFLRGRLRRSGIAFLPSP